MMVCHDDEIDIYYDIEVPFLGLLSNSFFKRGMVAPELLFLYWSGKFGLLTGNTV